MRRTTNHMPIRAEVFSLDFRNYVDMSDPLCKTRTVTCHLGHNGHHFRFEAEADTDDKALVALIELIVSEIDGRFLEITSRLPWGDEMIHPNIKARGGAVTREAK